MHLRKQELESTMFFDNLTTISVVSYACVNPVTATELQSCFNGTYSEKENSLYSVLHEDE